MTLYLDTKFWAKNKKGSSGVSLRCKVASKLPAFKFVFFVENFVFEYKCRIDI